MKAAKPRAKQKVRLSRFFHNRRNITIICVIFVLLLAGSSLAIVLNQKSGVTPAAIEQQSTNTIDDKNEVSEHPQDTTSTPSPQTSEPALSMKLTGQSTLDNKFDLSWKTSGLPEGTRTTLLFSRETSSPNTYNFSNGEKKTSFVDIRGKQSFTWDYPDGQTVWFRLCAYNLDDSFGQEELLCNVGVSNVISYQAPYVAEKIVQPGVISLAAEGTVLSWTHEGTAPFGFIVIGLSFVDFKASTTSTSMNIGSTPSNYDYFYVCKKGYYEQTDCSDGISVDR
jgi:hypothetical protein